MQKEKKNSLALQLLVLRTCYLLYMKYYYIISCCKSIVYGIVARIISGYEVNSRICQ